MDNLYDVILKALGKEDCQHEVLIRLHHVGSDTRCNDCGIVMKARDWAAFKERIQDDRSGTDGCNNEIRIDTDGNSSAEGEE